MVTKSGRGASEPSAADGGLDVLRDDHAFINILLYFRRVIDCGLDHDGYTTGNAIAHRRSVGELEVGLQATRALTGMGRALYMPVAEALA